MIIDLTELGRIQKLVQSGVPLQPSEARFLVYGIEKVMAAYSNTMKASEIGRILGKRQMLMKVHAGEGSAPVNGKEEHFNFATGTSGNPVIQSVSTGKTWTATWEELLNIAILKGLLEPGNPPEIQS